MAKGESVRNKRNKQITLTCTSGGIMLGSALGGIIPRVKVDLFWGIFQEPWEPGKSFGLLKFRNKCCIPPGLLTQSRVRQALPGLWHSGVRPFIHVPLGNLCIPAGWSSWRQRHFLRAASCKRDCSKANRNGTGFGGRVAASHNSGESKSVMWKGWC